MRAFNKPGAGFQFNKVTNNAQLFKYSCGIVYGKYANKQEQTQREKEITIRIARKEAQFYT